MKKLLILTGLGLGVACIAPAQITKTGNLYLIRAKYTAGSKVNYMVNSSLLGGAAKDKPIKFTLPLSWKVAAVNKGVATVDTVAGPVMMGQQAILEAVKNRIQVDPKGHVIGDAGAGQQVTPILPDKPIKVGQSWSATAPIALPQQGQATVKATYTFKGMKTVDGRQVAELSVSMTGKANGKGTMYLLASDGSLYKSNLKLTIGMGESGNYQVTAVITRK